MPRRLPRRFSAPLTLLAAASAAVAAVPVLATPTAAPSASPVSAPAAVVSAPVVTKVLAFVEENHSLAQMQTGMPYTYGLAKQYGYASSYAATTHPSLPNYLAIAGGDTFGVTDDNAPSSHPINAQTVFGQAIAKGKTAKSYMDGMPSGCSLSSGGTKYAVKHNPWAYFTPSAERSGCNSYDVPETRLQSDITAGTLPNVGLVSPNLCNDAHDCSLSTADSWFKSRMQAIMAGPDWKSGHLAVVLTADEDDRNSGNKVLTVVAHPSQQANVVSTPLTHYSLTRLFEDVVGASHLRNAATAPNMATAFGLPLTSSTATTSPTPNPTPAPTPAPTSTGVGFVAAKSGSTTGAALDVATPATGAGQVTVLGLSTRGAPTVTAPAGWTLVRTDTSSTTMRQSVFVKVATAAAAAGTARFALSSSQSATWTASTYSGVSTSHPVAGSAATVGGTSSTSLGLPALSVPAGGRKASFVGLATSCSVTPASGWTERGESTVSSGYRLTGELADTPLSASAAVTASASTHGIAQTVALNPA